MAVIYTDDWLPRRMAANDAVPQLPEHECDETLGDTVPAELDDIYPPPAHRAVLIRTRRTPLQRMVRAVRLAWMRFQLQCLLAERESYMRTGLIGVAYLTESGRQERNLRERIEDLELRA